MIEPTVTAELVAHLVYTRPDPLALLPVRPYDADEQTDAPPAVVVRTKSAATRLRAVALWDAEIEVTLRANPADLAAADFDAAWSWIAAALTDERTLVPALNSFSTALHWYAANAKPADSDFANTETERLRTLTLRAVLATK